MRVRRRGLLRITWLVSVLLLAQGASASAVSPTFAQPVSYPAGDRPFSLAVEDLDRDRVADLVLDSRFGVTVLMGAKGGSFAAPVTYPAGASPVFVTTGHLDSGATPDLAVVSQAENGTGSVFVLLGKGDGRFTTAASYPTGVRPSSVTTSDFNGDGVDDLAVANEGGSLALLLNRGDGTFGPPTFYPTGEGSLAVAAGDFNRDTAMDVAVVNGRAGTVSVLLGRGDGSFTSAIAYATGGISPVSVTIGRFNADQAADLAVVNAFTSNVAILLGKGDGTFAAPVSYSTLPNGNGPNAIATADVNSDGNNDLVTANSNSDNVTVLLGDGEGSFAERLHFPTSPPGSSPRSLIVHDLNEDRLADVVVANYFSSDISVLLNTTLPGRGLSGSKASG